MKAAKDSRNSPADAPCRKPGVGKLEGSWENTGKAMQGILLWLLLTVLALTGCSSAASVPGEPERIVVGVAQVGAESDWRVANSESMKSVFTEEKGYRLLFEDAKQKKENQIMAIRKFIQQRVDYIVLLPIEESGWESVLQEARDAQIPVILVDRMVDTQDESLYTAHIGADFLAEGRRAVEYLTERFPEPDRTLNIIHIQGTLNSTAQVGRTQALEEAVSEHPGWQILYQVDGDFTQAKTYELMTAFLTRQSQPLAIDVVYCENDNEAFGAIQALKEQGYRCGEDGVCVISFDATRNALRSCLAGELALTVECNPLLGPQVEQVIRSLEAGIQPPRESCPEETSFCRENLTQELIDSRPY